MGPVRLPEIRQPLTARRAGRAAEPEPEPETTVQALVRRAEQAWEERAPGEPVMAEIAAAVEATLPARLPRVIVVGGAQTQHWTDLLRAQWPGLQVVPVRPEDEVAATHVQLTIQAPFDLVVDAADTTGEEQLQLFQRTFMHLRTGGVYVARRLVPGDPEVADTDPPQPSRNALPNEGLPFEPCFQGDLWDLLSAAQAARIRQREDHRGLGVAFRDVAGLAPLLGEVSVRRQVLRVVVAKRASAKLREDEVDAVLAARPGIGACLEGRPAVAWDSTADYRHNRPEDPYVQVHFDVPALSLRRYDAPTCSRGQIVTSKNLLLPETFRQPWMDRMVNVYVVERAPLFGAVRRSISDPDDLPGAYFHFDSEWPGHFGHLLTEQVGRMWAWERARELEPGIKLLTTLQHDRDPVVLQPFELDVLGAFGITEDDIHVFERPCRPERLYTATSMWSLPRYVHPDMARTWDRIGDHLAARAEVRDRSPRLFVSRRQTLKRSCHNTPEVEQLFAERGFEIFYPEDHPLAEQVASFRAAEVVAGFGGSGLFSLALTNTPKQVITIGPWTYTARNEHLIASVRGHDLTSIWCTPDLPHPPGSWTQQAFASGFRVDFEDEGRYLRACLDRLAP